MCYTRHVSALYFVIVFTPDNVKQKQAGDAAHLGICLESLKYLQVRS